MRDFWTIGLSGAALFLRTSGFSWQESDRLLQLKLRFERGDFAVMWTKQEITARLQRVVGRPHEHQRHHLAARLAQPGAAQCAGRCCDVVPFL